MKTILLEDLRESLGLEPSEVTDAIWSRIPPNALSFSELNQAERDRCILRVLETLESPTLDSAGPEQRAKWERGWSENHQAFLQSDGQLESLQPRYFRHDILRYQRRYIRTESVNFVLTLHALVRSLVFEQWLAPFRTVIEFGCGTGTSLISLSERFPEKRLVGCDWTTASQRILEDLKGRGYPNIEGSNFDMFAPHDALPFSNETAIFTLHAMEQLGERFGTFLDYLLRKRPALCLHIEPIVEQYEEDNLLDFLAIRYHHRRGYLRGFLPRLQQLATEGRVELLSQRRLQFGSFFHEAYSVIVWRPC